MTSLAADAKVVFSLFLEQSRDLWPFYLGGVFFASFIKTFKWDRRVRASLVRCDRAAIFVAVGAGLISPLCSCGILPVVIALSAAGVPLPPVLALLITSPLMSPDAFLITVGQLGWTWALWKLAAAALIGLAGGFGALWLVRKGALDGSGFQAEKMYDSPGNVRPGFEDIVNAGCFAHAGAEGGIVDRAGRLRFFGDRFRDMAILVGKFLVPALLLQAVMTYYLPVNVVEPLLGRESALSVLFAALIAVPMPLPQVAAPALIKSLLAAGMSPGAGMAILIGGPVTSIPALSALAGVYDRRAFALYVGLGVAAAVAAGVLFQAWYG
ncbi:MAG: permease [Deltaproteobacteria bacterium]|nr:permease [Deltaproteobacteria bacterium]